MGWFKAKKNRRFQREEILDVRVETKPARRKRWRMIFGPLGAAVLTVALGYGLWVGGGEAYQKFVLRNDALAIRNLQIQTDGILTASQIRQWAGVKEGDCSLELDLGRIKRNLELAPVVREASVERILPATLQLRVRERRPVARAHVLAPLPDEGGFTLSVYLLDAEGYVMLPQDFQPGSVVAQPDLESMLIITGLKNADLRPGHPVASKQVFAALRLMEAFEGSAMYPLVDLERVDISTPEVLRAFTGQGAQITLGLDRFDPQLLRWQSIHQFGLTVGKSIASVDLSITNNLPVLWSEAGLVPPVKSKTPKNPKPGRNNVQRG